MLPGRTVGRQVSTPDGDRSYLLHIPDTPLFQRGLAGPSVPLFIVLHGSRARGAAVREQSGMDSVADAHGVLVAYPDGRGGIFGVNTDWNAGDCCGEPQQAGVDDIAFLRRLVADVAARLPVDRHRIYVIGFSDGGRMAYRTACEMSSEVAAVAIVAGSLTTARCAPLRAVPTVAFHGTSDDEVLYGDSAHTAPRVVVSGAEALPPSVRFWLSANRCGSVMERRVQNALIRFTGVRCAGDVTFFSVTGAGHAWPTPASPLIADFLLAQRLP